MLQLPAQEGDIDLHVVVLGLGLIAPDLQQQCLLGEHLLLVEHQQLHHVELLAAQAHAPLPAGKGEGVLVQPQVPAGERAVAGSQLRLAPDQGPDAGQQLPGLKGLGEIVVGAAVQALDLVGDLGPGRQHQHRGGVPGGPQPPQHREAVQLGQHHVQQNHVVNGAEGVVQPRFAVVTDVHGVAVHLQQVPKGGRQPHLVLDHQYPHAPCLHSGKCP